MGFEMDWSTLFAISDLSDTPWWQYMLGGAGITLALTFSAGLLALVVGTLVGIIRTVPNRALNFIGEAWVELFRNVPLLVQLFLWFFVVPEFIPPLKAWMISTDPLYGEFFCAWIGLGLFTSVRVAENVKSGIKTIPRGQLFAAYALGLSTPQAYRYVLLPLAFRITLPPLNSEAMNLMKNGVADYIVTGQWAKKAYQEAQKYGKAVKVASSEDKTFSYIPDCSDLPIDDDADYVYICENNTIYGTKYKKLPNTKGKTLVADVSSCFLSEPVDVTKYGVIYGGVQKNVGPAGVVIAIIREDLIPEKPAVENTPTMLAWKTQADADSLYNTPPCYGIYICGKVFKWLKKMGGLEEMQKRNIAKAKVLYDFLDESKLFKGTVRKEDRSLMNVPFVTGDKDMDAKFIKEATAAGFVNLKGHRTVGGMRASIYNAMPIEGVEKLVAFMKQFEADNA